jgi:hypothetical protein
MAGDVLVQTVLPRSLGKWVKDQAEAAGLSTAAWLRRLVMQAQSEVWVNAWAIEPEHRKSNSSDWWARWSQDPADIFLERVDVHSDGTTEFRAFDPSGRPGTPLFAASLESAPRRRLRRNLEEGWLVLEGSTQPWTVERKIADASADGQIVLFVRTVAATKTYYAYANAYSSPPMVGLSTSDPPMTGGVVFWRFETEETDHTKRLFAVEKLGPPFRLENDGGQIIGNPRPATQWGLDEALMEASALASVEPTRVMRLVGGAKVILRSWPRTT